MPKTRTTVTLDEEIFRAVKIKAARTGKRDSQVIEESLRRDLGLEGLEDLWARVTRLPRTMDWPSLRLSFMSCARRGVRRVVLDPGVLVSALITPGGSPAKLLREVRAGGLELVVSPLLLGELEGVLGRQKFRRYVDLDTVREYIDLIRREALAVPDPKSPRRCARRTPTTTI